MKIDQRRIRTLCLSLLASLALTLPASAAWYRDDSDNVPPLGASLGGRAMYNIPKNADAGDGTWFGGAQLRFYLAKIFGEAETRFQVTVVNTANLPNSGAPGELGFTAGEPGHTAWHRFSLQGVVGL